MTNKVARYTVLPLPVIQKWAKKGLSTVELREAIKLTRKLRFYPSIPDLQVSRFGDGMELRIEHPAIGGRGWLRAIFWTDEKSKTIYVVDLFWKKENSISTADRLRANQRIRRLKQALAHGAKPWGRSH